MTQGADLGARLLVDAAPRIVGRARGADLFLTDLAVSRKHLEVSAAGGGVRIRALAGAAPFTVGDRQVAEAELGEGDRFILGNTVLGVTRAPDGDADASEAELTDARTLLGGLADDVRGLASVFALIESLDEPRDVASLAHVLTEWAASHAGAVETTLVGPREGGGEAWSARFAGAPRAVVVRALPEGGGTLIAVPSPADGAILFRFADPPDRLGDHRRRLVVVAGRVFASSAGRLREIGNVEEDQAALRRQAVGSAQAFLGSSPAAEQVSRLVPRLAGSDAAVLLLGESGTGKTFVARLIHEAGPRHREPLRVLNCAAIPEALLEAELFGHERGAFTGAIGARAGAFESAGRGTLLLDEIGELPLTSQAKLLRVLEERRFERIGSNRALTLEARVIAATNRDLQEMVQDGRFRADLLFRISVVNVKLPALRERGDDVVLLAEQILRDLVVSAGRRVTAFGAGALEAIRRYPWPGNVRELRNAIEHALVLGDGSTIEASDFPEAVRGAPERAAAGGDPDTVRLPANLDWLEERAIEAALRATGGNRTRAAALLGINRVTLYKKLKEP